MQRMDVTAAGQISVTVSRIPRRQFMGYSSVVEVVPDHRSGAANRL
jgi:hypothetical protein